MAFEETGKPDNKQQGIVVIASSTGGPAVLHTVLPAFPESFSFPIVVVQHMWPGFTGQLAGKLNEQCPFAVGEAADKEILLPGKVYLAPARKHIRIKKLPAKHHQFVLSDEEPKRGIKPCADYLLESLSVSAYENIVVVVLTGMGRDASEGIEKLSQNKEIRVVVQDEESSVVYGMPGSVRDQIKDCLVLPPDKMAGEIMKLMEV